MERSFVYAIIEDECNHQELKWDKKQYSTSICNMVFDKKHGEMCEAYIENDSDQFLGKLIQCAALLIQWIKHEAKHDNQDIKLPVVYMIIEKECERQDKKWGDQQHSTPMWNMIFGEEHGEMCEAYMNGDRDQFLSELVQCAALLIQWIKYEAERDHQAMMRYMTPNFIKKGNQLYLNAITNNKD